MTAVALPDADLRSINSLITSLRTKNYPPGVVAVSAVASWAGPERVDHDGESVQITAAPSVLAIRDAVRRRGDADWTVVLTDRPASEIPVGVAEHLLTRRLLNLDPYPLLRSAFAATQQEFGLLGDNNAIARAMLRNLGDSPKPAPGAVLTNDHVFAELARTRFDMAPVDFTPHHVALWSLNVVATGKYDTWAAAADPALVAAFLAWLTSKLGEVGPVLMSAWRFQGPAQVVPLGLIAGLAVNPASAANVAGTSPAERVRMRLEMNFDNQVLAEGPLTAWGAVATLAIAEAEDPATALSAAEAWVPRLQAESLVIHSDVLPSALPQRVRTFAAELAAVASAEFETKAISAVGNAWEMVRAHRDARVDAHDQPRDVRVGAATLRLLRRFARPWRRPETLADWLQEYRRDLSWVDGAVNNAYVGADDEVLARAAHQLVTQAREARMGLDREFARILASAGTQQESGTGAPLYIENLLDTVVAPLTKPPSGATGAGLGFRGTPDPSPVLLVVADGMDAASSNEIVADMILQRRSQWQDVVLKSDLDEPIAALAVLPTVTQFSRCSLLTGALAGGGQDRERTGFAGWLQQRGLASTGQTLFHKGDLEAVSKGHALASEVRLAVQDTARRPVVACVLNDVDDALDRSDPIGGQWTIDRFKRLGPLLDEAAKVGRTVVLVSDHGHVVERREQPSVQRGEQISARYRAVSGTVEADEVQVQGPRVLTDGNQAVLAVDEQLRYTGLKAGYHGGAALSEAVIAVSILTSGTPPQHLGLVPSPLTTPTWWDLSSSEESAEGAELRAIAARTPTVPRTVTEKKPARGPKAPAQDGLFDVDATGPVQGSETGGSAAGVNSTDEVDRFLDSDLFARQYKQFGRRQLSKAAIGSVVREAMASNGVMPAAKVAELCDLKPTQARAAISWLAQILNVDGVIVIEQQGEEAVVATSLLFEQYGVSG